MFCVKCGEQLADGAQYCGKCGAAVAAGEAVAESAPSVGAQRESRLWIGWLLVAAGLAVLFAGSPAEALAVPLLWIGFAMVLAGSSVVVRAGKGLFAMFVVLSSLFFLREQLPGADPASAPSKSAMDVELATLLADYSSGNEVAADNKYRDKIIRTTGVLADIRKDLVDRPYVIVSQNMERAIPRLQCTLADSAVNEAARLQVGSPVTVQGRAIGLMFNVQAEECTFVQQEAAPAAVHGDGSEGREPPRLDEMPKTSGAEAPAGEDEPTLDQYCALMYRSLTPSKMTVEALEEFWEECPGFDLPIQRQEASPVEAETADVATDVEACVASRVAAYRDAMGEDRVVRHDMLSELEAECSSEQ